MHRNSPGQALITLAVLAVAAALTSLAQARSWTEAASGRKIEAEMVSADDSSVTIAVRSGQRFTLPLDRLTAEDQAFVRQNKSSLPQPVGAPPAEKEPRAKADRFEAINISGADAIPSTGTVNQDLAPLDEAIKKFMAEKGIGALTFAITKEGKVLHDFAYGWSDAKLKIPLQLGTKMRIASLTKPVISAAIHTLVNDGKLKMEDRVFTVLELEKLNEAKGGDERWKKITIQQLLEHKGGWDRDKSGDLTSRGDMIEAMFHIKTEETEPMHVVRYGLTLPLDFEPGERSAYSNYGYILLARVIEKLSQQTLVDYLQTTVAGKSKAHSFSLSASDARDRQPGEVWYCYHPEYPQKQVPLDFHVEARDGAGALACTAADYCRFLEHYWISGEVRDQRRLAYTFSGSLPGVTAICAQRADGVCYTAIANRRDNAKSEWNEELRSAINTALALTSLK
ncbi:serine hydrolase domain-containing protein [Verrucomicrobium sp. BvORR034]|uniref:serine hydrolase domain-containing protein n=1 Tax=Verrucomicrobium sp. BvORR034 TaxID=1396418 RepID=UPI0006785F11|nr:serine hydrolase domain-containing protein [Verrucomicrobium sp. BvORR034]